MHMLTGASRRLAKRHSATVRSPAPSHAQRIRRATNEIPGNVNMARARAEHRPNGPNRNEETRPIQRATLTQRSHP